MNSLSPSVLITGIILLFVLGCSKNDYYSTAPTTSTPVQNSSGNAVTTQNDAFNPKSLTVAMGTTVTWTNNDNIAHTVTSGVPGTPDGIFNSGNMGKGQTFSYMFNSKGTFKYYCSVHPDIMTGTVTVQ